MNLSVIVVFIILINSSTAEVLNFPVGFKFGAASSAYQIEGAWNVSDKGESVWDRYARIKPDAVTNSDNGDVACNSYNLWKQDVQLAANLGLHYYRFSISWSRLLPSGFTNHISEDGKKYYNDLIDALLENDVEPMVTLYHYDLPQKLQDLGGWANPLVSDWFADYAQVVFSLYGNRVKTWFTVNEPVGVCALIYNNGLMAPFITEPEFSEYICSKNILLAHAKAYRIYQVNFKPVYHGRVSLVNHLFWFEPYSEDDMELTELAHEYSTGRYSHPIFSEKGGWPLSLEQKIAEKSKSQGYLKSRLPDFTKDEIDLIKGTYDFYALNHYTSRVVRKAKPGEQLSPFIMGDIPDLDIRLEKKRADWIQEDSSFFVIYHEGMRKILNWLKARYGDLDFVITENGYCHRGQNLNDTDRISHMRNQLEQVLLALRDGVNITAYTYWTLLDNFEWTDGYTIKFGLHEVDFDDPGRGRTPRKSASYYASLIKAHSLNVSTEPSNWAMLSEVQNRNNKKYNSNSSERIGFRCIYLGLSTLLTFTSLY